MIINNLRAENVLKYSILELTDIPDKGLIAVIGDNESGKSSIGESVCFALFGRTFSLDPKHLDKVIRWGESRCSIKLDFTTPKGERYRIARFLDELGNQGASISRVGEEPMLRGVDEVETSLKGIIGFGYTEFIESFYLAQREITTPHPHSSAVKAMAGVDALEKIVPICAEEIGRAKQQIAETKSQRADIDAQITTLNVQSGYLASLEAEREAIASDLEEGRRQVTALKAASDNSEGMILTLKVGANSWLAVRPDVSFKDLQAKAARLGQLLKGLEHQCSGDERIAGPWVGLEEFAQDAKARLSAFDALREKATVLREHLGRLLGDATTGDINGEEQPFAARQQALLQQKAKTLSSRRTTRTLMIVFILLAIAAWGGVGLLSRAPDSIQATTLAGWLSSVAADWETRFQPWFPYSAGVLTLLAFAFLGRSLKLTSRLRANTQSSERLTVAMEATRQEAEELKKLDDMPLPNAAKLLSDLSDEGISSQVKSFFEGPQAIPIDPQEHTRYQQTFSQAVAELEASIAGIKAETDQEIDQFQESVEKQVDRISRLDETIAQERDRNRKNEELLSISQTLGAKIDRFGREIRVRNLATDLLQGASYYISQRFNHEVRSLSADSLPKLTNGRYEHLQIDENLKVKAFSNEKRDFMDLDEISSGTQRQIMLAVRLALSQKLANSVIHGPQMVFLDEPFAFFDEVRTASALAVLPQVSSDFTQIWVTSQTFPENSHFDMYVECNADQSKSPIVKHSALETDAE